MKKLRIPVILVLFFSLSVFVFAGGGKEKDAPETAAPVKEEAFSLEKLIELAKAEGELVVYDTSSKIEPIGELFSQKYGITVKATKMGNPEQVERVKREVDAKNIQVDVVGISDAPIIVNDLIPQGYVVNWVPPDLADVIPAEFHMPLNYRTGQRIFGYNSESYQSNPVTNIWQLTEESWKGKVFLRDPATTPANIAFFAALTKPEYAKKLSDSYKEFYGKPLKLTEKNAGWEWVIRFFKNDPVVMRSDGDVGDAVGAPGQKDAPIGFYTYAKQRDNEKGLKLAAAFTMKPFIGYASGTNAVMVNGCSHPNAAKLFIRFLLTEEGVAPFMKDIGVYSPNPAVTVHADDDLGSWKAWSEYMVILDDKLTWEIGQDILDLWLINTSGK
ncbi:MAG: ABC transporter substrate-binding protein [Spirochaetia bacterium]|jgi:iron(III) transport system substrate-binding protein|nr:ABC transporter substrate-binding protein [Spirochaetia bacterium]